MNFEFNLHPLNRREEKICRVVVFTNTNKTYTALIFFPVFHLEIISSLEYMG